MNIQRAEAEKEPATAPRYLPLETISVRLTPPPGHLRGPVFGIISNLSESGACLITNRMLPAEIRVAVEIETRLWKAPVRVSARVIWCAERLESVKEIVGYLTGVYFEPESVPEMRQLLMSGLFQAIP
jgi:hypothetical protein